MNRKLIITIAAIVVSLVLPLIFRDPYICGVFTMVFIYAVFAVGVNLISGYAGIMSYGQAAFLGIGGYAGALIYQKVGVPLVVAFLFLMVLCGIVGFFVGLLTLRLRAIYFSMTMMGVAGVFRTIAMNCEGLTNGSRGYVVDEIKFNGIFANLPYETFVYYLCLFFLLVSIYITVQLMRSFVGRSFVALRDGENLAMSLGVNTKTQKIYAFILSAIICGISGFLYGLNYRIIVPDLMNTNYTIIGLLIIMLGGKGMLLAPILGAVLYTGFSEILRSLGEIRMVIYAALLLMVVLVIPKGILGTLKDWQSKHRAINSKEESTDAGA